MKAATGEGLEVKHEQRFQSTPPVKAATPPQTSPPQAVQISIHAAREGGDPARSLLQKAGLDISIHAAREGGDEEEKMKYCKYLISIHAAREGGDP